MLETAEFSLGRYFGRVALDDREVVDHRLRPSLGRTAEPWLVFEVRDPHSHRDWGFRIQLRSDLDPHDPFQARSRPSLQVARRADQVDGLDPESAEPIRLVENRRLSQRTAPGRLTVEEARSRFPNLADPDQLLGLFSHLPSTTPPQTH